MVKPEPAAASSSQLPQVQLAKRKKSEGLDSHASVSKKKPRTRVSYSCGECHRRKQKCDRQIPCSHCIARKVPELCKAYTPGKSEQDIHARLSRLEQIIEMALPQYCSHSISGPPSPLMEQGMLPRFNGSFSMSPDDEGSQGDEGDIGVGTFDGGGRYYGKSVSGSVAPVTMLEQLSNVGSRDEQRNENQYTGRTISSVRHGAAEDTLIDGHEPESPMLQNAEPSAADLLQSLIRDCGLTEDKLQEFLQELPDRQFTDVLINYYFKNMNWTRYPISEQDFRQSYAKLLESDCGSNPSSIRFYPLLFVVLAISIRLAPEHIGGDARERRLKSMRFYWSSRRALLIAAAIQPDSLEMVLTRLLSARYLTFDRRITECWSQLGAAVCTAQALGLHRDPADMRLEPAQVEYRRRIWAYLYHADRSYSMVLGRPYAIQDEYTTTLPPLNIEDLNAVKASNSGAPLTTPTRMSFVILRHGLAYLIGKMVHYFQRVRIQNHYTEVLALDDDLQRFIDTLPPHFAFNNPDTSLDNLDEYSYIPLHRYLLTTEILFVRISLHRPYILRRVGSDRYARSRRACFESALKDYKVREAYSNTQSKDILRMVSNSYREFQTAMMSGIYLVLEPHGRDAPAMHEILEKFLKDHKDMDFDILDETTKREIKIIEFLRNKALQAETKNGIRLVTEPTSPPMLDLNKDAQANANLLLGLQQAHNGHLQHGRTSSDTAASILQRISGTGPSTPLLGPSGPIGPSLPHSPTFQRVQAQSTNPSTRHSPIGSGSPGADEDLSAQHMLDHWCNTVTNPLPMPIDSLTNGGSSLTSGQWGTFSTGVTGNIADWLNTPYLLNSDTSLPNGLEGADHTYWESLVNTIRGAPNL